MPSSAATAASADSRPARPPTCTSPRASAAGALVALKVARDRQDEDQPVDAFRRFLQEYEIAQRIASPAVVRLYDLGVSDEHAWLVMEYFPRGDLRRRMRAGLAPREALRLAVAIARALARVHAAGRAAPRSQARQRHAARGRQHRADRLRSVEGCGAGARPHRHRHDLRHAALHEPGAGPRRSHRCAQRPLQPRRHPVRDADRRASRIAPRTRWRSSTSTARSRCRSCRRSFAAVQPVLERLLAKQPEERFPARSGGRGAGASGGSRAAPAGRAPCRGQRTRRSCSRRPPAGWRTAGTGARCSRSCQCEKKAASTALALMFAYPEDRRWRRSSRWRARSCGTSSRCAPWHARGAFARSGPGATPRAARALRSSDPGASSICCWWAR